MLDTMPSLQASHSYQGHGAREWVILYPDVEAGHWHVTSGHGCELQYSKRPWPAAGIPMLLESMGLDVPALQWLHGHVAVPRAENPYAGRGAVSGNEPLVCDCEPPEQRQPAGGYIYFVQSSDTGLIKIGTSRDPRARVAALQTGASGTLRLLRTIPGYADTERELHRRFAHMRVRGEWFMPGPELLALIEETR